MVSFFKFIILFFFRKSGWRVEGDIPKGIDKAILIAGGHTSNWDLAYSLGTMFTLDKKFKFLIKKEALVFPIKRFLLSMGALPIDRGPEAKTNYVDQLANVFAEQKEMFLCIAPEGTRKATKKWKTGYYHIAKKADVPIIVCYLDCPKKIVHVGKVLRTNVSEAEMMEELKEILKSAKPKIPENFTL